MAAALSRRHWTGGREPEARQSIEERKPLTAAVALGLILTALVGTIAGVAWGVDAIPGAVSFGLIGLAIHLVAATVLRRRLSGSLKQLAVGFGTGMALRLAGALAAFVALTIRPTLFEPLPTLFGYAAVTVPLLFTEIRFLK